VPEGWRGQRILLNFGAVNWELHFRRIQGLPN
jgi:hypothetical protein